MSRSVPSRPQQQQGSVLLIAIFLITAIAALAAVVALNSTTQQRGSLHSLQAEQAWFAARSRLEQELPGILASGNCSSDNRTLFGYDTHLSCDARTITEGSNSYTIFTLQASASRGSAANGSLIRRSLRVHVRSN